MTWEAGRSPIAPVATLEKNRDGTYRFTIVLSRLRLRRKTMSEYWLADLDSTLPFVVSIDGISFRLRTILKIYKKISKSSQVIRTNRLKYPLTDLIPPKII